MPVYDYRWALGSNVALSSLTNVETDLLPYTHGITVAPTSQPVNPFPVRNVALSGVMRGEGTITHQWVFSVLPIAALDYILDTYLTVGGALVVSRAMTIYTRRHDRLTYNRYNCNLTLPAGGVDYQFKRGYVLNLTLTFTRLQIL